MATMKIALLLIQAALDELPGHYTPVVASAMACALTALIISVPMVWLMKLSFFFVIPGMMVIGIAAQAALITPYFLLPERCNGGLQGALAGILSLVVLGAALPSVLSLANWS